MMNASATMIRDCWYNSQASTGWDPETRKIVKNTHLFLSFSQLSPYFCPKLYRMATGSSKMLYWIMFLASTAALLFAIATGWEYLTMIIPFVCTFFVKAMDII